MKRILLKNAMAALTCAFSLGLGGSGAMAGEATYDTALEDTPCEVVSPQMVATALEVPKEALEQSDMISSRCYYEMDEDGKTFNVEVVIRAYDSDAGAAEEFGNATRSVSSEEIKDAMAALSGAGDDADAQGSDTEQAAAEGIATGLAQTGIQFEDVDNLADQARFATSDGTLELLQGNLRISLTAYYGPAMPHPDEYTTKAIMQAQSDWIDDTIGQRKAQAIKLAKLVLATL